MKCSYGYLVKNQMWLSINHIDKADFSEIYPMAQSEALKEANIWNGFMATGLVPYNPAYVLNQLQV